ncbi:MAG TPA: DUF2520 domain-containing protein [Stackebrandtia sp.]|jgi:predicted short-subunit dehydrogenase-like oxidoreductase (DUF2520 family)|uniref:Rossmann-like and DUF2520 domain-containing protein n=1 Tax=Stackebrandtia sp. TaxID=2023065 RepID=UPI002D5C2449|nr:DUF2520 domain-containing protein [Stackebrandtia sp.]HZE37464.1 DUF2520 domain-containing protein [Stackebrandtia sp.]
MATSPQQNPSDPSRLDIGVVSAGRVGSVLGAALSRAGHRVVATSAVSDASRARAARFLPGAEVLPPDAVAESSGLLLLAVPDDALPQVVSGLAAAGHLQPGQLVAHTCGAHGIEVLRPAVEAGALPMAIHPVMTFTGRAEDLDRLSGISFGVTAPEPLRTVAEALVVEMGGEPEFIPEPQRVLYHAALCHGANHLTTLINESVDLLRAAGVVEPEHMLAPLLHAALDNTLRLGDNALTGPIVRGDSGTVASHLRALDAAAPDSVAAYRELARRTADRAIDHKRLSARAAEPLLEVLAGKPRQEPTP